MAGVLIDVENVSKKYCRDLKRSLWYGLRDVASHSLGRPVTNQLRVGEFWANHDISLQLQQGECLGLLGGNGAGKSTLLKLLNGLILPDRGKIQMTGRVGALIELGAGFNPILTGRENTRVNGAILGMKSWEIENRLRHIVEFADIGDAIDTPVQSYSSGMRVRLGFAIAAYMEPDILLIDEVLAVGDTSFRMRCFSHLRTLRANGTAMILVSHNPTDIERMCSRALVLDKGRVVAGGEVAHAMAYYEAHSLAKVGAEPSGSHAAQFVDIQLLTPQLNTLDTLKVGIVVHNSSGKPLRVLCNIVSPHCGILGSLSSHHSLPILQEQNRLVLELPDLPLLIGGYVMNFWLYGPEITDFYDSRLATCAFEVVGPKTDSFGYSFSHTIRFKHIWRSGP